MWSVYKNIGLCRFNLENSSKVQNRPECAREVVDIPGWKHRGLRVFIRIQLVLMLAVIAAIAYYYVGGYASEVSRLHDEAVQLVNSVIASTFRSAETSVIYTADGEVLSTLKGEKDVY